MDANCRIKKYNRIMLRRIRLLIQYDGTAYMGWQVQPSGATIQGILQDNIFRITEEHVNVIAAGRTDAGVHAIGQVAAFDSLSRLHVSIMKKALNALLPPDVRVIDLMDAPQDFHPRYSALGKKYSYIIANMKDIPVFIRKYAWRISAPLDTEAMRAASVHLLGTHDFSSFRGSGCGAKNPVRTVHCLTLEKLPEAGFLFATLPGDFIRISIEADAFLRHMVRNIVGTLVETGKGKMSPERAKEILSSGDRRLAGPTAPAQGLFLEKVLYSAM